MKVIFTIQPQSIVDVITNSSTELFVFEGNGKKTVESLIKEVYKKYKSEYENLKTIDELDINELNCYIEFFSYDQDENYNYIYPVLPGFTFDEMYVKVESKCDIPKYELKINDDKYNFVTEENKDWVISKMDPDRKIFFLFSKHENPDYEMQERLSLIGTRYHLG